MNKEELRKLFKEKRQTLHCKGLSDRISKEISDKIKSLDIFKKAKNVLIFYPKGFEINVLSILTEEKNFYLPRCVSGRIVACPYKNGDFLQKNKYNILEPVTDEIKDTSILDIVITPALCADEKLYRLGWGGGYYDKFFKEEKMRAQKILVVPDVAVICELPHDDFDVPCDVLISESKILART